MTPEETEDAKIAAEAAAPAKSGAAEDSGPGSSAKAASPSSARTSDSESTELHPSVAARKLAPPPKPARDSRPSAQPQPIPRAVEGAPSALAPRAPMIVVGQPSQQLQREGAQAWTRPNSEPPRQQTPPWGNLTPRREPTPSVGVLRSRLEAREKSNPPREWSAVSPIPPKVAPPPTIHQTPIPEAPASPAPADKAPAQAVEGAKPKAPTGADSSAIATPLPHVGSSLFSNDGQSKLDDTGPDAPTPVPFGARADSLETDAVTLPKAAPAPIGDASTELDGPTPPDGTAASAAFADNSILPPRPKSGPARLRSGPPRPRASSPDFGAVRGSSDPPRPASAGGLDVPPPPKVPSFSHTSVAHITPPPAAEEMTDRRSEPPVPPSAIAVMKIIAVGDPTAEKDVEIEGDFEENEDTQVRASAAAVTAVAPDGEGAPVPVLAEELEELPVDEVAPDSVERRTPLPELPIEEAIPVVEDLEAMTTEARARELEIRPPPPPRRAPKTPSTPSTSTAPASTSPVSTPAASKPVPQAKRRQKRAWWEDVFGEDFVRANFKLSERQIRREVDFIEESLGVAAGGVVLDLGCGPGHHAVELASRGYGVVGYDLSLYQLALAAEVAQERSQRINFLQGDMREMAFEEMFDGIFSWNTSFGYFEEDKNLLVAERVFHALRPGGMFLIDVVNRDFAAVQSPCSLWFEGDSCVCMDDMSLDFITSRMRVKRSVILDDGRTRECVYSIRVYSMHELGKLLHDVGFRVTEASGHPSTPGVFFGEYSPRIIMLAQKP